MVVVVVALAGCSGSSSSTKEKPQAQNTGSSSTTETGAQSTESPTVTLSLLDGGAPKRLRACDVLTNYPTYSYGGFVRYEGKVTPAPSGSWSMQVKLKRCVPNGYSESFIDTVDGKSDGTFSGLVPKLNPNEFYVRADYRPSAGRLYSSRPAYFRVVR